jgi:signal transduction histidine kinase
VPNIYTLERYDEVIIPDNFPIYTFLSVSMYHESELIGCLDLVSLDEIQLPSKQEIALIQAIANQAATAIANAKLFEEVTFARNQLQQISLKLVQVQEQERRFLARELHDEIGGLLTSLRINLDLAARSPEAVQNLPLIQAQELADELIKQIREISLDLRPTILDDLGLLPALLSYFEQYSKRTRIAVDFKHKGIERRFSPSIETTAFRSIQEALTNIARHANVGTAAVRIWANDECLYFQIKDEGKGFDFKKVEHLLNTSGLSGIRERVKMCQGNLDIEAIPNQGTCLTVELPLNIDQEGARINDFDCTGR